MAKMEAGTTIDRPVEDVWKFVTDLSNMAKWNPEVLEPKQTSAGPLGVGTTGEFRAKMGNKTWTILIRVTKYEPNRRFSFEQLTGPLKGTTTTGTFETTEGKTRFTLRGDLKFSGFYKLLGPFVVVARGSRGVVVMVGNVKRTLESEAQS